MDELSLYDQTLRELGVIESVFKAQIETAPREFLQYPSFAGPDGKTTHGRFLHRFDVVTNTEIFNLQKFKIEMTTRFEQSNNHTLLRREFKKLRQRAAELRDYYNNNLTTTSPNIQQIVDVWKMKTIVTKEYAAVVEVIDYRAWCIHFESEFMSVNRKFMLDNDYIQYISSNFEFARYLVRLIDFIDMFELVPVPPQERDLCKSKK